MLKQRGLTLVELMITVAIVAILMTVGAPGISSMLQQNQVIADINNISSVARAARFTAVDEGTEVILCPTKDYKKCKNNWKEAKMAFIDENGNGELDENDILIAATEPLSDSNKVKGISGSLVFGPDGSVSKQATIEICPSSKDNKSASALLISLYGRLAVATDSDNNGIKEDADGADLSC
ncbi:GspH/FimT family pseudopilin [Alteromonas lipotrueiana]|uniref:GspH/FimT family pseudopilin n=1 Tax=Alteromonas lipotrueiana TaxID=2803815 RepID=UPI001C44B0EC|nr:GspH/FimT family pseudopilin [Alteromonas lipotrueiana]